MKKSLFTAALTALLVVGLFSTAALAGTWTANPGTTVSDDGVVTLHNDPSTTPLGTSYENDDLGLAAGAISFEYRTTSLACGGGVPRLFIEVNGAYANTFDGNPNQCGTDLDGDGWSTVTSTPTLVGTVGHFGIVNDNPSDPGTIEVRNVTIGGVEVIFTAGQCKDGGWVGSAFRNQGQCVSSFN